MAVFSIVRAGRQDAGYMENLITNVWNAAYSVIYRKGYGILTSAPEDVIEGFRMVHNAYQRLLKVRVHHMELIMKEETSSADVCCCADRMGRYFYDCGYQAFITVMEYHGGYLVEIIVNAASYTGGKSFHDNNANYMGVLDYLKSITPYYWEVSAADNVFFHPQAADGNYERGVF